MEYEDLFKKDNTTVDLVKLHEFYNEYVIIKESFACRKRYYLLGNTYLTKEEFVEEINNFEKTLKIKAARGELYEDAVSKILDNKLLRFLFKGSINKAFDKFHRDFNTVHERIINNDE